MKVQNITDVEGFFKVVDSCKGRVELVTGEGDRLNPVSYTHLDVYKRQPFHKQNIRQ